MCECELLPLVSTATRFMIMYPDVDSAHDLCFSELGTLHSVNVY